MIIDAAAGGSLMNRSDAYNFIEEMTLNQVQWSTERVPSRTQVPDEFETDQITKLQAMVEALQIEVQQSKILDYENALTVDQFFSCAQCGGTDHLTINCVE
jgi:acetylglutamate kinase